MNRKLIEHLVETILHEDRRMAEITKNFNDAVMLNVNGVEHPLPEFMEYLTDIILQPNLTKSMLTNALGEGYFNGRSSNFKTMLSGHNHGLIYTYDVRDDFSIIVKYTFNNRNRQTFKDLVQYVETTARNEVSEFTITAILTPAHKKTKLPFAGIVGNSDDFKNLSNITPISFFDLSGLAGATISNVVKYNERDIDTLFHGKFIDDLLKLLSNNDVNVFFVGAVPYGYEIKNISVKATTDTKYVDIPVSMAGSDPIHNFVFDVCGHGVQTSVYDDIRTISSRRSQFLNTYDFVWGVAFPIIKK